MHSEHSDRLDALVAHLPFAVDDFEQARETFLRWHRTGHAADLETSQLWAYGYILWYFYGRFSRESTAGASDVDEIIEDAFRRILDSMDAVRDPERFPQYVSVVCRNLLYSYRVRRKATVEITEATATVRARGAREHDRVLVRRVIEAAFDALPPAVGRVARMRLLDEMPYETIAETTGLPLASTRTYVSKALTKLRDNPDLRALHDGADPMESTTNDAPEVRSGAPDGLRS